MTDTQDEFKITPIDFVHINPSILEGNNLTSSLLGSKIGQSLFRYAPINIELPVIIGSAKIPSILTCLPGVWDGSPRPLLYYQWMANGEPIPGQIYDTMVTDINLDEINVTCQVTGVNPLGVDVVESNQILLGIIEPIVLHQQNYSVITGLTQTYQINHNHHRVYVASGLWVDVRLDTLNYNPMIISGINVPDIMTSFSTYVGVVQGVNQPQTLSTFVYENYVTEEYMFDVNLPFINPSAETGDITGWINLNGFMYARSGTNPSPSPGSGSYYFAPGDPGLFQNNSYSSMSQTVSIPESSFDSIDTGYSFPILKFKAIVTSSIFIQDTLPAVVSSLFYLDENYNGLAMSEASHLVNTNTTNSLWMDIFSLNDYIPPLTRHITLVLSLYKRNNSGEAQTYVDDIRLDLYKLERT